MRKPGQVFNRVHVDDVVSGLFASMDRPRPGAAYILCDDEPAPAEVAAETDAPAQETPAASPSNLSFADKTEHATVSLTLPEGIKAEPDLHARTYAEEVRNLRQFEEGALAARTEAEGDEGMPPFEKTVTVTVAGQTDRLFSLRREAFDYSGGAHPNTLTTGIVWDRSLKRLIGAPELFRKGADRGQCRPSRAGAGCPDDHSGRSRRMGLSPGGRDALCAGAGRSGRQGRGADLPDRALSGRAGRRGRL